MSRDRPIDRCDQCGSVYEYEYIGPPDDDHHAHHVESTYDYPKTFADYLPKEYWYK